MATADSSASGVDPTKPSIARIYGYSLGGKDHFAVDREVAAVGSKIAPEFQRGSSANRAFIQLVVRYLVEKAGITQFLDLGSGLPTDGNVHEIAQAVAPEAKTVYVDNDPMVLSHGRALLARSANTIVVDADVRRPQALIKHPDITSHLDFSLPVGLLMFAILHHINDDEDPKGIMAMLREPLCPGSYLAISHFHNPGPQLPHIAAKAAEAERAFNTSLGTGRWRSHEEIREYFGDFEILEPGLAPIYDWLPPEDVPAVRPEMHVCLVGALTKKP